MANRIKVIISGPRGRMGKEAVKMVTSNENFELVGVVDRINEGKKLYEVDVEFNQIDCTVYTDLKQCIEETKPDCLVELSVPQAAFEHIKTALAYKVRPVVGTTGLNKNELEELKIKADEAKTRLYYCTEFCNRSCFNDEVFTNGCKIFPRCGNY